MTDFLTAGNARLMRILIGGPSEWSSQREISDKAEVAAPQVNLVLKNLAFHRLVERRTRGVKVNRPAVRRFFGGLRKARLSPIVEVEAEVTHKEIGADGIRAVLALFTAANIHAPFELRKTIDVIFPTGKARAFAKGVERKGGSVIVRVFEDSLDSIETSSTSDGVATSPLQTIVDLDSVPEGERFAKFLASNVGLRRDLWPST